MRSAGAIIMKNVVKFHIYKKCYIKPLLLRFNIALKYEQIMYKRKLMHYLHNIFNYLSILLSIFHNIN